MELAQPSAVTTPTIDVIATPQYKLQEDPRDKNLVFEVNHPLVPPPKKGFDIRKILDTILFLVLLIGGFLLSFFMQVRKAYHRCLFIVAIVLESLRYVWRFAI